LTLGNLSVGSANITTLTGTNLTYTSGTVTNLNSTSANITTLTGTTFGTTATTQLRGASAQITTLTTTSANITTLTGTSLAITTVNATNVEATNIKAKDGTSAIAIANTTGAVTVSTPTVISVNSASDALRITQAGAGNALVVEDSTNPDSTPFVVDTGGAVMSGSTSPFSSLSGIPAQVSSNAATNQVAFAGYRNSADTTGAQISISKSRGTASSPTIVNSGDNIGQIWWTGYDGSNYFRAASIACQIDTTPASGSMPGRLIFSTTLDGSSSPTERMRIDNAGTVFINTTTNTNSSRLVVSGTISETVSSTQYLVASQFDVGTAPNQIPLNQYLGTMAFQDSAGITVGQLRANGTGGIGYSTGAGSAVTQATSRTTGVTINAACGAITLVSAAGTTSWQTFTVTNSAVAATDTIVVNQKSGTDLNMIHVTNVAAGSFKISFATTGGTTTEQPVFNFAVIKAVAA
jgi:hypothetical protein